MEKKRGKIISVFSILLVLIGVGILMYPAISNYVNTKAQDKEMSKYNSVKSTYKDEDLAKEWKLAKEYNDNLKGEPVHDPFDENQGYVLSKEYDQRLNIANNGVMGNVIIPQIDVNLPIYHGCSEEVLKNGVGHIEGTSLPVGGKSTHVMLSAHRGLPEATLFTYLDKLKKGDIYYLKILDKTMAYKVYNIQVIEPKELDSLRPTSGKDIVTLITCTPYGKNTQRLLVHAERTKYTPAMENNAVKVLPVHLNFRSLMFGMGLGVLLFILLYKLVVNRKKRSN